MQKLVFNIHFYSFLYACVCDVDMSSTAAAAARDIVRIKSATTTSDVFCITVMQPGRDSSRSTSCTEAHVKSTYVSWQTVNSVWLCVRSNVKRSHVVMNLHR